MRTKQSEVIPPLPTIKWGMFGGTTSTGIADPGSNDWTTVRTALGAYVVTFNKPFVAPPSITLTPYYGGTPVIALIQGAHSASGFTVAVSVPAGSAIDSNVMFIAIGISR